MKNSTNKIHAFFTYEVVLTIVIISLGIIITFFNPTFMSVANILDMIRSSLFTGILGIGAMVVIISGGIDISFPAIAAFSMYSTTIIFNKLNFQGSILLPMLVSAFIGVVLGSINALIIHYFKIPTLIATIGTSNLFSGILLTFIGSRAIMTLPKGFVRFARSNLIAIESNNVTSSIPSAVLLLVFVSILAWFILKYSILGKGIYALGGSQVSAKRVGFNVGLIQLFIYSFAGFTAGIGGLTFTALMRTSNPFDLLGTELSVIAAVVLGGTRVSGGYGSVIGVLLGVFLITMINNSLILVGISTYYQRFVLGLLILIGSGVAIIQERKLSN